MELLGWAVVTSVVSFVLGSALLHKVRGSDQ